MHQRKGPRRKVGELPDSRSRGRGETGRVKEFLGLPGRFNDVLRGDGGSVPGMTEEIPAQQGAGGLLNKTRASQAWGT